MFEQFGNFDSAEALNQAAQEIKSTGDEDKLKELAKENGIDLEDAEDYMDDCIDELATDLSAALGKLKVEKEYLRLDGVLIDWADEVAAECTDNVDMRKAVRAKDKCLAGYIAVLANDGFKNRVTVSKEIVKRAPDIEKFLHGHEFSIGVPNKATRKSLMFEYYLGR